MTLGARAVADGRSLWRLYAGDSASHGDASRPDHGGALGAEASRQGAGEALGSGDTRQGASDRLSGGPGLGYAARLEACLLDLCREADVAVPMWLAKNTKEFARFSRTSFLREQFPERVPFDYMEIWIVRA